MILMHWEGYVESLNGNTFFAVMIDKAEKEPDVIMEIYCSMVLDEDKHLIKPGYYLDLIISDNPEEIILKFKTPVKITKEEKEQAEKEAEELMKIFEAQDENEYKK